MEFKSEAHKDAHETARACLFERFGDVNVRLADCCFVLEEGSALVYVRTFPIGDDRAAVEVFSYVLIDVQVTEHLRQFLLSYNLRLVIGAFGLIVHNTGKGDVLLTRTLLADCLDATELCSTVSAIARIADKLDDEMVAAFGGKTALGKLTERRPPDRSSIGGPIH
jgi:hypothetical protein